LVHAFHMFVCQIIGTLRGSCVTLGSLWGPAIHYLVFVDPGNFNKLKKKKKKKKVLII